MQYICRPFWVCGAAVRRLPVSPRFCSFSQLLPVIAREFSLLLLIPAVALRRAGHIGSSLHLATVGDVPGNLALVVEIFERKGFDAELASPFHTLSIVSSTSVVNVR